MYSSPVRHSPPKEQAPLTRYLRILSKILGSGLSAVPVCCEVSFVASRPLCQTFSVRQHLRSIISFGGGGRPVVAEAPWWRPLRRGRRSMSPFASFVKGVWRFFSTDVASVHPARCGRLPRRAAKRGLGSTRALRKGRLRRPFLCLRQRPGARGRRCACRPAAAPRSPAAAPAGRLPLLRRPP